MKTLKTIAIVALTSLLFSNAYASIVCHTPRMSKVFNINEQDVKVSIVQNDVENGRGIASNANARTLFTSTGYTKVMQHKNLTVTLHVDDKNNFSELNDYLIVKDQRGHEITYPLTCYNNANN